MESLRIPLCKSEVHLLKNSTNILFNSKFCVSVSGFRPRGEPADTILSVPYSTPTVLVLGTSDPVVSNEISKTLCDVSSNLRIEYHDGGAYTAAGEASETK